MKGSHRRSPRHKAKAGPAPLHQRLRSPVHPSHTSSTISDTLFPSGCTFPLHPHRVPALFPQHHIVMVSHCLSTRLSFEAQGLGLLTFIVSLSLCPLGEYITHRPSKQVYCVANEQREVMSQGERERGSPLGRGWGGSNREHRSSEIGTREPWVQQGSPRISQCTGILGKSCEKVWKGFCEGDQWRAFGVLLGCWIRCARLGKML